MLVNTTLTILPQRGVDRGMGTRDYPGGDLELDLDTEINIEWKSPFFCEQLSHSYDFTVPASAHNMGVLFHAAGEDIPDCLSPLFVWDNQRVPCRLTISPIYRLGGALLILGIDGGRISLQLEETVGFWWEAAKGFGFQPAWDASVFGGPDGGDVCKAHTGYDPLTGYAGGCEVGPLGVNYFAQRLIDGVPPVDGEGRKLRFIPVDRPWNRTAPLGPDEPNTDHALIFIPPELLHDYRAGRVMSSREALLQLSYALCGGFFESFRDPRADDPDRITLFTWRGEHSSPASHFGPLFNPQRHRLRFPGPLVGDGFHDNPARPAPPPTINPNRQDDYRRMVRLGRLVKPGEGKVLDNSQFYHTSIQRENDAHGRPVGYTTSLDLYVFGYNVGRHYVNYSPIYSAMQSESRRVTIEYEGVVFNPITGAPIGEPGIVLEEIQVQDLWSELNGHLPSREIRNVTPWWRWYSLGVRMGALFWLGFSQRIYGVECFVLNSVGSRVFVRGNSLTLKGFEREVARAAFRDDSQQRVCDTVRDGVDLLLNQVNIILNGPRKPSPPLHEKYPGAKLLVAGGMVYDPDPTRNEGGRNRFLGLLAEKIPAAEWIEPLELQLARGVFAGMGDAATYEGYNSGVAEVCICGAGHYSLTEQQKYGGDTPLESYHLLGLTGKVRDTVRIPKLTGPGFILRRTHPLLPAFSPGHPDGLGLDWHALEYPPELLEPADWLPNLPNEWEIAALEFLGYAREGDLNDLSDEYGLTASMNAYPLACGPDGRLLQKIQQSGVQRVKELSFTLRGHRELSIQRARVVELQYTPRERVLHDFYGINYRPDGHCGGTSPDWTPIVPAAPYTLPDMKTLSSDPDWKRISSFRSMHVSGRLSPKDGGGRFDGRDGGYNPFDPHPGDDNHFDPRPPRDGPPNRRELEGMAGGARPYSKYTMPTPPPGDEWGVDDHGIPILMPKPRPGIDDDYDPGVDHGPRRLHATGNPAPPDPRRPDLYIRDMGELLPPPDPE